MARQERERRYIAEYVLKTWPGHNWKLNVPLGEIPEELIRFHGLAGAASFFHPQRRRVDAVSWSPDAYFLIEAKIRDPFEGIGRLIVYAEEAKRTPDLPEYTGQPVIPRLVVPFVVDRDRRACLAHDIELVEYHPPWIDSYVQERQRYFTREYREERAERARLRDLFGLE